MGSLFSDLFEDKNAEFDKRVEAIEAKYHYVFDAQINRITGETPDKLSNHFILNFNGFGCGIGFDGETYVPKYIQDEVIKEFKDVFSDK